MVTVSNIPLTLDPFVRLPYEISIECLFYAFCGWELAAGPLPYMAVSSHWCKTILGSPPLWRNIVIDGGEDERARVETFLLLSRDHPLDVDVVVSEECSKSLESLFDHKWRIRSLTISRFNTDDASPSVMADRYGGAIRRLVGNGVYPALKRLRYNNLLLLGPGDKTDTALMSACPQLRILQGPTVSIELAASLPPGMREISLKIRDHDNLSEFLAKSSLQELYLYVEDDRSKKPEQSENTVLKRWATSVRDITKHTSMHLQRLTVGCSLRRILVLLSHLPSLPELDALQISMRVESTLEQSTQFLSPPVDIAMRPKIRSLGITWNVRYATKRPDKELQNFIQLLCNNLAPEYLLDLGFWTGAKGGITAGLRILLRSACNLNTLKLYGLHKLQREGEGAGLGPLVMDKLMTLSVSSPAIMPFIYAPNVRDIEVLSHAEKALTSPALAKNFGRTLARLTVPSHLLDITWPGLSSEAFMTVLPKLESLTLRGQVPCQTVMHLTSVHLVSFKDSATQAARGPFNAFLVSLLRNPQALPWLKTLESNAFPLWDPLFEVVHSRFRTARVRAIARVLLPSYPALPILSTLVRYLRGTAHLRYSRYFDDIIRESASKVPM